MDLGIRIRKHLSLKNLFYPQAQTYHFGSVSTKNKKEFFYYLNIRNKIYIGYKHNNKLIFFFITLWYIIIVKVILSSLINKNKNLFKGGLKGIIAGFKLIKD